MAPFDERRLLLRRRLPALPARRPPRRRDNASQITPKSHVLQELSACCELNFTLPTS
jgi:hypothetical protein